MFVGSVIHKAPD